MALGTQGAKILMPFGLMVACLAASAIGSARDISAAGESCGDSSGIDDEDQACALQVPSNKRSAEDSMMPAAAATDGIAAAAANLVTANSRMTSTPTLVLASLPATVVAVGVPTLEDDFGTSGSSAQASCTYPSQVSNIKIGDYVMIKDRPCKVVELYTFKTGKGGHAQVFISALDIFRGTKLEEVNPATHNINTPFVHHTDYQVIDMEDKFLGLMDDHGDTKSSLAVPAGELGEQIKTKFANEEGFFVTVLSACDEEKVVGISNIQ
jgi:translation initiation factor 5A